MQASAPFQKGYSAWLDCSHKETFCREVFLVECSETEKISQTSADLPHRMMSSHQGIADVQDLHLFSVRTESVPDTSWDCFRPWGSRFRVCWMPLQVKANRGLHSSAVRTESALAIPVAVFHLPPVCTAALTCPASQHSVVE